MRSFKSNENIHKKEGGSYYVVSANKASSVTLQSSGNESQRKQTWFSLLKQGLSEPEFMVTYCIYLENILGGKTFLTSSKISFVTKKLDTTYMLCDRVLLGY